MAEIHERIAALKAELHALELESTKEERAREAYEEQWRNYQYGSVESYPGGRRLVSGEFLEAVKRFLPEVAERFVEHPDAKLEISLKYTIPNQSKWWTPQMGYKPGYVPWREASDVR
jgi:hypothetical protein